LLQAMLLYAAQPALGAAAEDRGALYDSDAYQSASNAHAF